MRDGRIVKNNRGEQRWEEGGRGEWKYLVSRGPPTVLRIKLLISFKNKNRLNKQKEKGKQTKNIF